MREIFLDRPDDAGREGLGAAAGEKPLVELRSNLAEELPAVPWSAVSREIGARIDELLDVRIDGLLVSAWKKLRDLQEYRDPARHPPEEVALVPLAEHTVKSSHRPHVEILLRDTPLGRLDFDIRLALRVEGVVLKVQGGRIREIQAGSWSCKGTLEGSFAGEPIFRRERETETYRLDAALPLGEGVEIPEL